MLSTNKRLEITHARSNRDKCDVILYIINTLDVYRCVRKENLSSKRLEVRSGYIHQHEYNISGFKIFYWGKGVSHSSKLR